MNSACNIQIWHARLADFSVEEAPLSLDERQRAAKFKFERDRKAFLVRRLLLRTILAQELEMDSAKIIFSYSLSGKPQVEGLHFNLSHSNGQVAIAISKDQPVGVDIEFIRAVEDRDLIAQKFFSAPERATVKSDPDFFCIWSRKEAFLKATGEGITHRLAQIDVTPPVVEGVAIQNLAMIEGFSTAIAAHNPIGKISHQLFQGHKQRIAPARSTSADPVD